MKAKLSTLLGILGIVCILYPLYTSDTLYIESKLIAHHSIKETIHEGDVLGVLSISKLDIECTIYEGVSDAILDKGIGHLYNNQMFKDNVALAGHRATYFKRLDELINGDTITINSSSGSLYTYIVEDIFIVDPKDIWVVAQTSEPILTLITCTNFNTQRLIVRARLQQ